MLNRKMLERPNICYIFEKLGVQGCQIWHSHSLFPFNSAPVHSTCPHNAKKHYFKADSESKTCGNPTKDQRADHLSANASNFKPTRDFIKVHDIEHTHQNWLMDKWNPADVVETFDNVLVSIAVNQNFLSEKGGPLERIITERGNNFAVQLHVSTFIKLYFAAPRFRC